MSANDGAVAHSNQMRPFIKPGQNGRIVLEHTCLAQTVEAFPDAVAVAEPLWQSAPGHGVKREIMQRFEKQTGILCLRANPRQASPENLQCQLEIPFCHLGTHRQPPNRVAKL